MSKVKIGPRALKTAPYARSAACACHPRILPQVEVAASGAASSITSGIASGVASVKSYRLMQVLFYYFSHFSLILVTFSL